MSAHLEVIRIFYKQLGYLEPKKKFEFKHLNRTLIILGKNVGAFTRLRSPPLFSAPLSERLGGMEMVTTFEPLGGFR